MYLTITKLPRKNEQGYKLNAEALAVLGDELPENTKVQIRGSRLTPNSTSTIGDVVVPGKCLEMKIYDQDLAEKQRRNEAPLDLGRIVGLRMLDDHLDIVLKPEERSDPKEVDKEIERVCGWKEMVTLPVADFKLERAADLTGPPSETK